MGGLISADVVALLHRVHGLVRMKYAMSLPPTGTMANPVALVEVAIAAEAAGWDGFFLWDHVLRPPDEPREVADPWVTMAAIASATSTIRIGPMVTPMTRRRPIKLARETVTLDHLSNGRLTLGLGLGVDSSGELSRFGEVVDPKERGQRLDEGIELLCAFWSGEPVSFKGQHFMADDVTVLPRPVQRPRIPLWLAATGEARKPVRRAALYDGMFPINVDARGLAEMLDLVRSVRGDLSGFDVALHPTDRAQHEAFAELGMTWSFTAPGPETSSGHFLELASAGPAFR